MAEIEIFAEMLTNISNLIYGMYFPATFSVLPNKAYDFCIISFKSLRFRLVKSHLCISSLDTVCASFYCITYQHSRYKPMVIYSGKPTLLMWNRGVSVSEPSRCKSLTAGGCGSLSGCVFQGEADGEGRRFVGEGIGHHPPSPVSLPPLSFRHPRLLGFGIKAFDDGGRHCHSCPWHLSDLAFHHSITSRNKWHISPSYSFEFSKLYPWN